jgi:hypothetical protein
MKAMNRVYSDTSQMSVKGHYQLARTLYFIAMLPPLGLAGLCVWILPQLPPITEDQLMSYETIFLGFTLLSAVLCDTLFYLRLRRFRALPTRSEIATTPPLSEVKKGWRACAVAWGLVQLYAFLGVCEAFFTREASGLLPFLIFAAITMFRCRPRHGLFAEYNWGVAQPSIVISPQTNGEV